MVVANSTQTAPSAISPQIPLQRQTGIPYTGEPSVGNGPSARSSHWCCQSYCGYSRTRFIPSICAPIPSCVWSSYPYRCGTTSIYLRWGLTCARVRLPHRRVAIIGPRGCGDPPIYCGRRVWTSTSTDEGGVREHLAPETLLTGKHSCTGNTVERETLLPWNHSCAGNTPVLGDDEDREEADHAEQLNDEAKQLFCSYTWLQRCYTGAKRAQKQNAKMSAKNDPKMISRRIPEMLGLPGVKRYLTGVCGGAPEDPLKHEKAILRIAFLMFGCVQDKYVSDTGVRSCLR